MSTIKVLGICGSLRRASANMGLLRHAASCLPAGMELQIADLSEVPFYNADLASKPAPVARLLEQIGEADALLLACPEYNYSMAPALKNALDWASREPENKLLAGKPVAIMGAGGGMGTSRAQYHLRQTCVFLDLLPLNKPEVFANAFAGGFDGDGNLTDERLQGLVAQQLEALRAWALRLKV
ncbi:NAD(P)H-dependent FMN reductase [Chromobacterium violaceum]|uniref:FMN-dependent NADPH-azoreductase n=2 Tax=Chromobacterium violaceum TaxID=536 RepID=A0A202BH74_CHRVL|nr:NADPH-dependent FMN reductase [Chromobacterium violaceum]KJH66529.1 NADPH-dependent FMN reductase [Chromobacterium violaceum]MBA8733887.1 NAD(P)H-dependent oxidoreductase [Chromobacterium violaceum]MBP4044663.1 NAD(P)H-dependent oxidoreductase [Chromobacterium violaceum]MBP4050445.1 NAD(P)H-dependent oxidoreductase [Chromobacterium violaceum]MBX9267390.1 NAD(P)H-dependent oxidoreductase [Chromobacterium violaceum]